MARKDATRRSKVPAEVSPQHADKQEQDGGAAQQQPEQGLRRRRQPQAPTPAAAAAASEAAFEDPCKSMPWYSYYPRQYGGLTLGTLACASTVRVYDPEDPLKVHKMLAALALALVALLIHEFRPFQRMQYGDKAKECGMGVGF